MLKKSKSDGEKVFFKFSQTLFQPPEKGSWAKRGQRQLAMVCSPKLILPQTMEVGCSLAERLQSLIWIQKFGRGRQRAAPQNWSAIGFRSKTLANVLLGCIFPRNGPILLATSINLWERGERRRPVDQDWGETKSTAARHLKGDRVNVLDWIGFSSGYDVSTALRIIILRPSNFPVGSRLFHMDQKSISSPQVMRVR